MKLNKQAKFCVFAFILISAQISCLHLKKEGDLPPKHIIVDHSADPSIHHVIRRNPTVTAETHIRPLAQRVEPPHDMEFTNTNDNNGPDIPNSDYGKSPEIAGPAIYTHSKGTLPVVVETPAIVGERNEKKVITSFNKNTHKVEQHEINVHSPITGNIEEIQNLKTDTSRRFDLGTNQWGAIKHTVSK